MRHGKAGKRFGRKSGWRKATVRDIAKATLIWQRIRTTESRAKESRKLVDRLITLGKDGTLAAKRRAFAILCDHNIVSNLFDHIAPRFKNRAGGYTRIIPLGENRRGDNARLVFLELTEKEVKQALKGSSVDKASVKEKKETAAETTKAADKAEAKEARVADIKKKEVSKKDEKSALKVKEKVSKLASGGIRKIFRTKKPE
jgi:large subunit ribosomal protein L17